MLDFDDTIAKTSPRKTDEADCFDFFLFDLTLAVAATLTVLLLDPTLLVVPPLPTPPPPLAFLFNAVAFCTFVISGGRRRTSGSEGKGGNATLALWYMQANIQSTSTHIGPRGCSRQKYRTSVHVFLGKLSFSTTTLIDSFGSQYMDPPALRTSLDIFPFTVSYSSLRIANGPKSLSFFDDILSCCCFLPLLGGRREPSAFPSPLSFGLIAAASVLSWSFSSSNPTNIKLCLENKLQYSSTGLCRIIQSHFSLREAC